MQVGLVTQRRSIVHARIEYASEGETLMQTVFSVCSLQGRYSYIKKRVGEGMYDLQTTLGMCVMSGIQKSHVTVWSCLTAVSMNTKQ